MLDARRYDRPSPSRGPTPSHRPDGDGPGAADGPGPTSAVELEILDDAPARPIAVPLETLAAEIDALNAPPLRAAATRQAARHALQQVGRLPGVETTADLTPMVVAEWVREMVARGLDRSTIKTRLINLGTSCRHAVLRGYLGSNPVAFKNDWLPHNYQPRPAAEPRAAVEAFGQVEATRLMAYLLAESGPWEGHRIFALASTILLAGLRLTEAAELLIEDCDLAARTIRLRRAPLGQGVREMPPILAEILAAWVPRLGCRWLFPGALQVGPWTGGGPGDKTRHHLTAAGAAVGLAGITFEQLREHWSDCRRRVALGASFHDRRAPDRDCHPAPAGRPGRKPSATTTPPPPALRLDGPGLPPIVWGVPLLTLVDGVPVARRLSRAAYEILDAMLRAGCLDGALLTASELNAQSGHGDSVRELYRMRDRWPALADLIKFPTRKGNGGYGLNSWNSNSAHHLHTKPGGVARRGCEIRH